jgi:hypothetical protein
MSSVSDVNTPKPSQPISTTTQRSTAPRSYPLTMDQVESEVRKSYSLDWKLIGIRALSLFSGALMGVAIGAAIIVAAGVPVAGAILLLSNPIGIGITAAIVLVALAAAYKHGGGREVLMSGLTAILGTVFGLIGGAVTAVGLPLLALVPAGGALPPTILLNGFDLSRMLREQHLQLNEDLKAFANDSTPDFELRDRILREIDNLPKEHINYHPESSPTLLELAKVAGDQEIIDRLRRHGAIDEDRKTHVSPSTGEEEIGLR